jgi:hypothetical protein
MAFHVSDNVIDFMMEVDLRVGKQIQKALKLIKSDPTNPSLRRHKLSQTPSRDLVSYSPNKDIRIICLEPNSTDFYLVHANHHDLAYRWAETRKVSLDTITGGVQVISLVEKSLEFTKDGDESTAGTEKPRSWADELPPRNKDVAYLFDSYGNAELASLGITARFTELVRRIRSEDDLAALMTVIPSSLVDILVDMIPGGADLPAEEREAAKAAMIEEVREEVQFSSFTDDDSLQHWIEDLEQALGMPFARWKTYLHPAQRKAVTRNSKGALRIAGGAGTGKTVVGLHRIKYLIDQGFEKVTMITYNRTLADSLGQLVTSLYGTKYPKQIEVLSLHDFLSQVVKKQGSSVRATEVKDKEFLLPAISRFPLEKLADAWTDDLVHFVYREIVDIIAPQRIRTEAEYIKAPRPGRARPLNLPKKKELWRIYEMCWRTAVESGALPYELLSHYALEKGVPKLHDHALIVDEVQDLGPADLAVLAESAPDANQLTLLEDRKQRIYGRGYSLKKLGINVVGKRSVMLYVNYRTTDEIAAAAGKNLPDDERNAIGLAKAVRKGEPPLTKAFKNKKELFAWLIAELKVSGKDLKIGIIAQYRKDLEQMEIMLQNEGISYQPMFRTRDFSSDAGVTLSTMHSAKGLEFEHVYFVDVGKGLAGRDSEFLDEFEKADKEKRERHLRYVAFSRARDRLVILQVGN